MKTIAIILGLSFAALAQQPSTAPPAAKHGCGVDFFYPPDCLGPQGQGSTGTKLGLHVMGETFHEWLQTTGLDARLATCLNPPLDPKHKHKPQLPPNCDQLLNISNYGNGTFGGYFLESGSYQPAPTTGLPGMSGGVEMAWVFRGGKLVGISITRFLLRSERVEDQLDFLTQAYGKPALNETIPYQNGYGARFEGHAATWQMPDGVRIQVAEVPRDITTGLHLMSINFQAREYQAEADAQSRPGPNPYK